MLASPQLFISTSFSGAYGSTAAHASDVDLAVRRLSHSGAGWRTSTRRYLKSMSPLWNARSHHDSIFVIFLFTVTSQLATFAPSFLTLSVNRYFITFTT